MLTGALGLLESYPFSPSAPDGVAISGPVEMPLGSIALFGADALSAKGLGVPRSKRDFVNLFVAVGLLNTDVLWGHPEDAIAVGLTSYAIVALIDGRREPAGWILGAAIALQPSVLLVLPLAVDRSDGDAPGP